MYNWISCKLNGIEITSLRLEGNLVWEKQPNTPINPDSPLVYYTTVSDDFDLAIELLNALDTDNMISMETIPESFVATTAGTPAILVKKDLANSVSISYYVAEPVNKWFTQELDKGVLSVDDQGNYIEGQYDVATTWEINGELYNLWTTDSGYIIPMNKTCKITIA